MLYCTRNTSLKKPQYSDAQDIVDFNDNMDIIDGIISKCNFNGATDPGVGDDIVDGYSVGSRWYNNTAHKMFEAESVATGSAVWRQIWPGGTFVVYSRHLPILPDTGGAEIATTTWKEAVFYAPSGASYTVLDAGVIPDYGSSAFGAATNYFSLGLVNKGTTGTGTTAVSAVKAFSSAATVMDAVSFGAISSASVSAGEVLAIEKTITGDGLIVQGCTFYVVLTKDF